MCRNGLASLQTLSSITKHLSLTRPKIKEQVGRKIHVSCVTCTNAHNALYKENADDTRDSNTEENKCEGVTGRCGIGSRNGSGQMHKNEESSEV